MTLIYDLTFDELISVLLENGFKKYRAQQIFSWLYKSRVSSFKQMTNLNKELIVFLETHFIIDSYKLVKHTKSKDGLNKFLFKLHDGNLIETVLIKHDYGNSICVSTQVGCNMACFFCASGKLSKKRDLTSGEIVMQLLEVEKLTKENIRSVVVMGIGEPFDNFDNLIKFLNIITDQKGINIGSRKITVSTSGIPKYIKKFADLNLQVNLALSLHAADNKKRSKLMPINNRYPIEKVMSSIKYFLTKKNRRITIEYLLIENVNDTYLDAQNLINLLRGINAYVNLIPYNEISEINLKRSSKQRQLEFYDYLKKGGIMVTLRREYGRDIDAACGQLRSVQEKNE